MYSDTYEEGLKYLAGLTKTMAKSLSDDELIKLIEGFESIIVRLTRYIQYLRVAQSHLEKELIERRLRGLEPHDNEASHTKTT